MSIDGIWTSELHGPFGWESRGIVIFDRGRVFGGDHRQFTSGRYSVSGETLKAEFTVHYYGPPRTVFGEKAEQWTANLDGVIGEGVINAQVRRPDRPQFEVEYRLTRRMDLPGG